MKRVGIIIGVLAAIAAGYWGYATYVAPRAKSAPEQEMVLDTGPEMIWTSGTLLPARWASLSLEIGGTVDELHVESGQDVVAGELLALLDVPDLEHALAQAKAALALAEAQLAQVEAGPRPGEIAAAEAQVQAAAAAVTGAEAAVSVAEAGLEAARAQPTTVEAAQAALTAAEAELALLRAGPRREAVAVAEAQLQQAATELAFAQSQFDRLSWVGGDAAEQVRYQRDAAAAAHGTAQAQLDLAKTVATEDELAIGEAAVAMARAQLAQAEVADRALAAQVASAEAGVEAAQAQVASAQAGVAQAEAQLQSLRDGATEEEIAISQAHVDQAQVAVNQAEAALEKARLDAPFSGTVGQILVREGELLMPGQPVVILGDLSHLRVETTDLRETDVAKVSVGQVVEVTFDALPGEVYHGEITRIAPKSSQEQGSTNYTAIVELEQVAQRLRWGMTAFVNIPVEQ